MRAKQPTRKKFTGYRLEPVVSFEPTKDLPTTIKVSFIQSDKEKSSAVYTFSNFHSLENREPRGLCRKGIRAVHPVVATPDEKRLPQIIMGRFPDIGPLEGEEVRLQYIKAFNNELDIELTVLKRLDELGEHVALRLPNEDSVPIMKFKNGTGPKDGAGVLLCQYVEGISLREWCRKYREIWQTSDEDQAGLQAWFEFAYNLTKALHSMHLAGAPHGYICPDNVIVKDVATLSRPKLINLEWDTPDPALHVGGNDLGEDTAWGAKLCWRRPYDSPDKIRHYHEISDSAEINDPFVPGDIFSLGLTLLYLAGSHLTGVEETLQPFLTEKRWKGLPWNQVTEATLKTDERIKDDIFDRLKKAFDLIADKGRYEGIVKATEAIFACLRVSDHRFYNARSILDVLSTFGPKPTRTYAKTAIQVAFKGLGNKIEQERTINPLVAALYRERLYHNVRPFLEADTTTNKATRFTAGRNREEIVDGLSGLLLQAQKGWTCRALTTPTFWFPENCGPAGRVLSALKIAAVRGCRIQVLILLNEARMNVPKVVHVMNQHRCAFKQLKDDLNAELPEECKWGWHILPADAYKEFLRTDETFIELTGPAPNNWRVVAIPDFASEAGQIIALRIFPVLETEELQARWKNLRLGFEKFWEMRLEMVQFPHK